MNGKKAQTAIELLTVYGWVVLLILVLFIVAYYSGYLNFTNMLPQYCSLTPTMACSSYKFGLMPDGKTMVLVYRIVNGLGYDIYFSNSSLSLTVDNIGKAGKNVYNGSCYPNSVPVKPGSPISCIVMINDTDMVPQIGKNLDFRMQVRYRNCEASEQYKVDKNCSSAPEYTVGGTIRTQMEPKGAGFYYCGDHTCDYALGETPSNCPADCIPPSIILSAIPNSIPANGADTATVNVSLADSDGDPMPGVDVVFTTTRGNFPASGTTSLTSTTDSSGRVSVALRSNSPKNANGSALINASALVYGSFNISNTTMINFMNYPVSINLILNPQSVQLGGTNSSSLSASLMDENDNPLSTTGLQISFSTNSSTVTVDPQMSTTDPSGIALSEANSSLAQVAQINASFQTLLNSSLLTFTPAAPPQTCNPPATGDWLILSKVLCKDVTILLNGNLNVTNTGDLTFMNVTLKMNVTSPKGIFVNAGNFTILDDDNNPATTNDNSKIVNNTLAAYGYLFNVYSGSNFLMRNSELHYSSTLSISADNAMVQNSIISNNKDHGIYLNFSSKNTITNSIVSNNGGNGIYLSTSNNNSLTNITANSNTNYGIYLLTSNNNSLTNITANSDRFGIVLNVSSNNNIFNNVTTSFSACGIDLYTSSNNTFTNIDERFNGYNGMYLESSSNNNTFTNINANSNQYGIDLFNSNNNTFTNINASSNPYNGINLRNFSNSIFTNINASSDGSIGFDPDRRTTGSGILLTSSNNNTFTNINANSNRYNGIYLSTSSSNTINTSIVSNNSGKGIYITNSNSNIISSNTISNTNASSIESDGINLNSSSSNNIVSNNIISSNGGDAIDVDGGSSNNIISNNSVLSTVVDGISFEDFSNNNVISQNIVSNCQNGIYLINSTNNTVINNNVLNNNQSGISLGVSWLLKSAQNNIISNNIVSNNNQSGIYISYHSNNNIISNNTASNNIKNGISIYDLSSGNGIINNIFSNNNGTGIYLYNLSSNNNFNNNAVSNNGADGIHPISSNNNTINNNIFSNNIRYGINLESSAGNNTIYNNLLNNTNNARFASGTYNNSWNIIKQSGTRIYSNGDQIGGNYWTNSSGTGYSDTCTDSNNDGFCDSPWDVLNKVNCSGGGCSNNTDFLPLSKQYQSCNPPAAGDWTITGNVLCMDSTINLPANLYIQNAATLTFMNVTLFMTPGTPANPNVIEVQNGGKFYVYEHNSRGSNITSVASPGNYVLLVDSGAQFVLQKSELHNAGANGPDVKHKNGLYIEGTAVINNSIISNNVAGVTLNSSSNSITGNTFSNNGNDVVLGGAKSNTISGNTINSEGWGIFALNNVGTGAAWNTLDLASNNTITSNNITLTPTCTSGGVLSMTGDNNMISNNIISTQGPSPAIMYITGASNTINGTSVVFGTNITGIRVEGDYNKIANNTVEYIEAREIVGFWGVGSAPTGRGDIIEGNNVLVGPNAEGGGCGSCSNYGNKDDPCTIDDNNGCSFGQKVGDIIVGNPRITGDIFRLKDCIIRNNHISGMRPIQSRPGRVTLNGDRCQIYNNIFEGQAADSSQIEMSGSYNNIYNNSVLSCTNVEIQNGQCLGSDVLLVDGSWSNVTQNNMSRSVTGIYILSGSNYLINSNNISGTIAGIELGNIYYTTPTGVILDSNNVHDPWNSAGGPLGGQYGVLCTHGSQPQFRGPNQYDLSADVLGTNWDCADGQWPNLFPGWCWQHCNDTLPSSLTYSLNSTDSKSAGTAVKHSLYWNDTATLSGYIFRFDNCTGTLVNDPWVPMTGTADWSNVTKTINSTVGCTVRWCVYANDTNGNWNNASCSSPYWTGIGQSFKYVTN